MADNYIKWSTIVENLTPEEAEWLSVKLERTLYCVNCEDNFEVDKGEEECPECSGELEPGILDNNDEAPGFEFELTADRKLWAYSSGNYSVDNFADLMQKFLFKFRRDDMHVVTFSYTCSKMRVDEFGGGGVVISSWGQEWRTFDDMEPEIEKLKKRKPDEKR